MDSRSEMLGTSLEAFREYLVVIAGRERGVDRAAKVIASDMVQYMSFAPDGKGLYLGGDRDFSIWRPQQVVEFRQVRVQAAARRILAGQSGVRGSFGFARVRIV
jgi:hypothetical protein